MVPRRETNDTAVKVTDKNPCSHGTYTQWEKWTSHNKQPIRRGNLEASEDRVPGSECYRKEEGAPGQWHLISDMNKVREQTIQTRGGETGFPGGQHSKYKGPEAGAHVQSSRRSKEAAWLGQGQ